MVGLKRMESFTLRELQILAHVFIRSTDTSKLPAALEQYKWDELHWIEGGLDTTRRSDYKLYWDEVALFDGLLKKVEKVTKELALTE